MGPSRNVHVVSSQRLFRSFDTDRDGSVDYEEFRNGIQAIASSTPAAPQHAVMFYENMGNEAVECPAANAQSLEASGALTADTLVKAVTAYIVKRSMASSHC
jgi:pyruvate/2-oxoglutarate dehydrogenase complex dihydrolipoamide acyltransferase (E2) component